MSVACGGRASAPDSRARRMHSSMSRAPVPWPRADGATARSRTSGRARVIDHPAVRSRSSPDREAAPTMRPAELLEVDEPQPALVERHMDTDAQPRPILCLGHGGLDIRLPYHEDCTGLIPRSWTQRFRNRGRRSASGYTGTVGLSQIGSLGFAPDAQPRPRGPASFGGYAENWQIHAAHSVT